jgi:glycosyltransferase involved in cell wall biosynthesis
VPGTALATQASFLRANSEAYEWILKRIHSINPRRDEETVLRLVASAAQFAATFHPGRFADGAIENVALDGGAALGDLMCEKWGLAVVAARKDNRRRVLHVASQVSAVGGHSRMLYHWVRNDHSSSHSLVLVDQGDLPVPKWLLGAVSGSGGDLACFPSGSHLCQRAAWLRDAARRTADLVVLHHGAFDVVPTVAFAEPDCPPVVLLNHADHLFWLGSSVSDLVINLRTAGCEHTATRRFVSSNAVLPIPLAGTVTRVSRRRARRALGIPDDQTVLLSIGRAEKYRPCGPYDFVSTAGKILNCQPGAHLYVVGESLTGIAPYLRCAVHERLHFVGSLEDPVLYRQAADVYMESFPFGSQTALLEAALEGLPVVPAYAPLFPLLVSNDDALSDVLPNPHSEQEYVERVDRLIQEPERRAELGETLQKRLLVDHVGEGWLDRLASLYLETDRLTHRPRPIPVSTCSMTYADISLSLWHVVADGKTYTVGASGDGVGALLCHSAFVAKDVGNYTSARRFAWRAVRRGPFRRAVWRLFAITVLGRAGRLIRAALHHT